MPSTRNPSHAGAILALVLAGQFLVVLDVSIVNVALPSMQEALGFSDAGLDAASAALADPGNAYTALRKFLDAETRQLEEAENAVAELAERLSTVELKGRWHNRDRSIAARQTELRSLVAPARVDDDAEVLYLATDSATIVQLLPAEADEAPRPAHDASPDGTPRTTKAPGERGFREGFALRRTQ